jgi:hypothetical protein
MSNYRLEGKSIVENQTGHTMFESNNKRELHKRLAFLNMGGAFDGWTPDFFLLEMPENNYLDD